MENIQTAIQHAYHARPSEFKNSVLDALNDKIQNHIEVKRMELIAKILNWFFYYDYDERQIKLQIEEISAQRDNAKYDHEKWVVTYKESNANENRYILTI
jgi:hypothetical protein